MNILSARSACLVGLLALPPAACGGAPSPVEVRQRYEATGQPPVDVRISLQPEHRHQQARYLAAVAAALKASSEWLGPFPHPSLVIIDPPWLQATAAVGQAVVLDRTPWWSVPTSMTPEMAVTRALSRRRWMEALAEADLPDWFVLGLAEYSARRAVTPLFEAENLPPGFAFLEERFLGGFVPRFVRIRLLPETDGQPLTAYRARPGASPATASPSAADARSLEGKTTLALGTLERWVGRPVFDQVVSEFVREARTRRSTLSDFSRVAAEVSGQDLRWFFDEVFGSSRVFDYGVEALTVEPDVAGGFITTVVARRYGDATFSGSSARAVGDFEAGQGISLLVTFADGQQRTDYWDGRGSRRRFQYHSPARAVSAVIDPGRTLLLDLKQANNSFTLEPRTRFAASVWAAHYALWLEHLLLTFASLG